MVPGPTDGRDGAKTGEETIRNMAKEWNALTGGKAEVERLTAELETAREERDEARAAERALVSDYGGNVSLNLALEDAKAAALAAREDAERLAYWLDYDHSEPSHQRRWKDGCEICKALAAHAALQQ